MSPEERALRYWNSVRANYPNLSPDASDFWEACPTHLAKEFAAARTEERLRVTRALAKAPISTTTRLQIYRELLREDIEERFDPPKEET